MKKVLHISSDYTGSKVYKNLVSELDKLCLQQFVYTPIRDENKIGENDIEFKTIGSKIIYSQILNYHLDRIFYRRKIKKILNDIESKIDFSEIDIIHAHTWYSDGGVAYLLHKKYNIPYIITIRNTDLSLFQKYFIHERGFGMNILKNAMNIVLITSSYQNRILKEKSLQSIKSTIVDKLKIIPNGVDNYWINNSVFSTKKTLNQKLIKCLYIGKFYKRKNVVQLQTAIDQLNKELINIHLDLIGGGGRYHKRVLSKVVSNPTTMTFHGQVNDKNILKEYFRDATFFAMPSSHETFGLVYVEAMLQGLPILYTDKEGIDGFYNEEIGEKVFSNNVTEIKNKILKLIQNIDSYSIPTSKLIENHDWSKIALKYMDLYSNAQS